MSPFERLQHHVTGAIDRGEAEPIVEVPRTGLPFFRQLAHLITEQDRASAKRKGYNPYALGIMLGAAHECEAEVANGAVPETAFTDHFTPTSESHHMARKLGLKLDVVRGQWVKTEGN